MPRPKLELPGHIDFRTELTVRVTDCNYGGHLGNQAVLGLAHEVRVRWLRSLDWTELDVAGAGLIMSDAVVLYKHEAFAGDRLEVQLSVDEVTHHTFVLIYQLREVESAREVARVRTGMAFFDYQRRELQPTPPAFYEAFSRRQTEAD